jgi:hypothetical protein
MDLAINFTDGSAQAINLPDDFKWDRRETRTDGNRKDSNLQCLIDDLCNPKKELKDYVLTSHNSKILSKWKRY